MESEALYFNHLLLILQDYVNKEYEGIKLTEVEQKHYKNIIEELRDNNINIPFEIEI